ncbi:MAG TPA: hypothetical protein VN947_31680 [Polyangia bacterium]|nr:hypothetical protein [Polyangia bacterium]
MAVVVLLVLGAAAAVFALIRERAQLHRAIARLEQRIAALELDHAPTLVIEPDRDPPPRPPNAMLN